MRRQNAEDECNRCENPNMCKGASVSLSADASTPRVYASSFPRREHGGTELLAGSLTMSYLGQLRVLFWCVNPLFPNRASMPTVYTLFQQIRFFLSRR